MRLYHYTSTARAAAIIKEGKLRPSESNIGTPWQSALHPYGKHAAPPVVSLIDTPTPTPHGHNRTTLSLRSRATRITVEIPNPIRWADWEFVTYMDPEWRQMIIDKAGGHDIVDHWYVVPGAIRPIKWEAIDALPAENAHLVLGPTPDEHGYHEVTDILTELGTNRRASLAPQHTAWPTTAVITNTNTTTESTS